jgi:hypothetical protein
MKTAIGYPPIYFSVYLESSPSSRRHIGSYSDIRDAIQAIVTAYKWYPHMSDFLLVSTTTKPKHWLHPTKYRDDKR